jgi:DNA-binding NarL/FixJ family response regulator
VPIRVVLAEDNLLVREGLRQLLATVEDIDVVAVCEGRDDLFDTIERESPDVVLTDIRMPPGHATEGIEVANQLRRTRPAVGLVALSQFADAEYALQLFEGGSSGRAYLLKERVNNVEQIASALREVTSGGSVVDPKVVEALVAARAARRESPLEALTARERDVLAAVAEGKSNSAIGRQLFLAESSVEKHINSIFSKLGLSEESEIHRRVRATLLFLTDQRPPEPA